VVASAALSGFFALISYALHAFRRVQLEEAFKGDRAEKRLAWLESNLTALKLTVGLYRALANLTLVVAMIHLLDAPAIGAGIAAAVIAVFGVAIPHAWAAYAGEKALAAAYLVLVACRYVLYPITAVMHAFDVPIRRLTGLSDQESNNSDTAKQEILQAASEGRAEGAVNAEEVDMIESVIEFGRTHAGQIMTPRTDIFALPVETSWDQGCTKVVEAGHTRVPVYQGNLDNIIGVLYAKDLLGHIGGDHPPNLRSVMRKPYFVPETMVLNDLLREFKARKVHMAVVLDEYGGTSGLVTIEDVLEEIVGEIADEYDRVEPALMKRIDRKTAEVDGRLHIDDLNDIFGLDIPEDEDYDTVAGFIFSELGFIPTADEILEAGGAKFTVLAADERKISKLRVELIEKVRREPGR
jgi:CBS domain containing-hemolysin-like protein